MLEFIPEKVGSAVVVNVMHTAGSIGNVPLVSQVPMSIMDSFVGSDYAVGIHNWLIGTQLKYVVFDLQEEKDIPADFLEELLQLMRRMRVPFLFAGVMPKPKAILTSYAYTKKYPIFENVDEAVGYLREKHPELLGAAFDGVHFGVPIEMVRTRLNGKPGEEGEDTSAESDD